MTTVDRIVHQFGERGVPLDLAWHKAQRAVDELGMTALMTERLDSEPSTWSCTLLRDGAAVDNGFGSGKGSADAARVGAVYEALEHHLSSVIGLTKDTVRLRGAHDLAAGPLSRDAAVALLAEGPDQPLACLPYRRLDGGPDDDVPIFLSMPDFLDAEAAVRAELGDRYDYGAVGRYSVNTGWAAGTHPVEARVHALNECVERDALSLLLIEHFIGGRPLRVVDRATLPDELRELLSATEDSVGGAVHLIDMTSDLGVPCYYAYTPAPAGRPARVRGCGASLSARYAATRSLTELVQVKALTADRPDSHVDRTGGYPTLHACYLADFTPGVAAARPVPFRDNAVPATPAGHHEILVRTLAAAGFPVYARDHWLSENLAVVNVMAPALERFLVVTDGEVVLPGPRGMAMVR